MSDTPVIRRAQFRGVTLSRDDLVAEARKYLDELPGWPECGDTPTRMADFAMMIAARVALRMTLPPGYVVVPREPTPKMVDAAVDRPLSATTGKGGMVFFGSIYRAMIAAATKESEG